MNLTKVVNDIKQIPCSEHEIDLLGGSEGKIVVQCKHCKQKWMAEEFPNGETETSKVPGDFVLPAVIIPEVISEKEPVVEERHLGVKAHPLIKNPNLQSMPIAGEIVETNKQEIPLANRNKGVI